ncbi:DUF4957 domain-containing protein [Mucilaginibacter mali]|uniref:DUF4957 domain-containing protein n=1 Tax=Mucilaginibacter mali TaxID=2740462 RepID=A0A7D4QAE8_9SPHI|nr:DUF4957 domain-containing protein [Mucilaginibacter mali]QKJ30765.1 DUF4957 domain-containing protein [Mucilaginibacter mali]
MKKYNRSISIIPAMAVVLIILGMFNSACKKNFTGEVQDTSVNRQFTPSGLSVSTVRDSAKFKWNAPLYALKGQTYTLDLSTDSLFAKVDYSVVVDTLKALFIDPQIKLNTPYFTRVKANAFNGRHASNYFYAPRSFRLVGQQYLKAVRDFEITGTTTLIHWSVNDQTAGLTTLVFTPATGTAVTTTLSAGDVTAGQKLVTGLTPGTKYTVQLLAGAKSKGIINITTAEAVTYTTTINAGGNLGAAITAAVDGDVIGVGPGTYSLTGIYQVLNKTITIRSTSNNPADTKLLLREIDLIGDGAGITLAGLDINGNYTGTTYNTTPIVLYGTAATTGAAANFANIKIDNCVMHDYTRCIIRGNYGTAANVQTIGAITINNSIFYNFDQTNVQGYYMFSLEKLQLKSLSVTKSTFYNVGDGMVNMGTALAAPANLAAAPVITFDYNTFNGFSGNTKYPFIDANANLITFNFNNSIVANTPISGSINTAAFRASNTQNALSFSNNNYFKFNVTPGGSIISLTGLLQNNNQKIDLGWTAATTNFLLVPTATNTAVFSASSNGGTVGDPRWAY